MSALQGLRAASVLFFLSGATGLVYEVIWFKRFTHVWGSSSLALAAVVASFLGGLALGAGLCGRIVDRVARPLRWYGLLELAIAALVLAVPAGIALLQRAAAALYPTLQSAPLAHAGLQALLTFLAIGPPTILMGATLPLLVRRFGRVGWLYGINTVGAACGCYLAGFHLLPALGFLRANFVAAGCNAAVGLAALLVARPLPALPLPAARERAPRSVLLAAALAGAGALVLQVAWNRELILVLGGSTYTFTAVLFVVLLGIGLGGMLFQAWRPRVGTLVFALVCFGVAGRLTLEPLTMLVGELRRLRTDPSLNALVCAGAGIVVQLGACVCGGALFPALVAAGRDRVGGVYAANTVGAIAGAMGATLALVPSLGVAGAFALGLALYLGALLLLERRPLLLLAGLALLYPASRPTDPLETNIGVYLFGEYARDEGQSVLFFRDGATASILVRANRDGTRTLHVNGKPDASNSGDMEMQLGLAYFPRFLRPDARDVCVIGYGSGTTAGASLRFPDTNVTCCEIEPSVVTAGVHFRDVNHGPEKSDRFRVVLNDGRHFLQGTDEKFDLILSEPSNPWMAGIANLFTAEFYAVVRDRLRPRGMFAQWIQAYSLDPDDYARIVRTVGTSFRHLALLRISDGDTILLASLDTVTPHPLDAAEALARHVADDLEKYFGETDLRALFLERLLLNPGGLQRAFDLGGADVNTDHNLRLEFDAPRRLFREGDGLPVNDRILGAVYGEYVQDWMLANWRCERRHYAGLERLVGTLVAAEQMIAALSVIDVALKHDPQHPWFLAARMIHRRAPNSFALRRDAKRLVGLSPGEAMRAGRELSAAGEHLAAIVVLRVLAETRPQSAEVWARLALSEKIAGDPQRARAALERAESLDPFNEHVRQVRAEWE